jgi:hypothetical protein
MFSRSGSTEVTFDVSCAKEPKPSSTREKARKPDKYRCMFKFSICSYGKNEWATAVQKGKLGLKFKWDC